MKSKLRLLLGVFTALLPIPAKAAGPEDLAAIAKAFATPPESARPWVYWFWNNGNVTKAGITADLEAMKRAKVGGVIIMDVVERFPPPPGSADFMNAEWRELFRFSVVEAHRLGIEINMTNGPGWCGSSGPWITPELSMQTLVSTNLVVTGPLDRAPPVPQPDVGKGRGHDVFDSTVKHEPYYRDIAVLAFPEAINGVVSRDAVIDLTVKMDTTGNLNWKVPAGKWIIQRIGHTTTGSSTRPPVKGGNGLECDKLSREAMDVHFANMMGKLITSVGPMAGPTLSATHIDSWEVGSQNWTPKFREEFQKRRGYDPLPFLPDITSIKPGGTDSHWTIGDKQMAGRFRWDYQQTISELLAVNYVGRLAELAHDHGMRLTIEGYNLPLGDEATYTARADEPMSEFWATGGNENQSKGRQMASVAHIMGQKIVGAEAFTSGESEAWKMHPATVKALGDYQFSQGINRFVIHRYAHQPYLDRFPGATMGPWGLHYERTQTWWEMSKAWHEYLARCQFMLRQGWFVADLCYLRPEHPDQTYFNPQPAPPVGYKYDEISAEALITRVKTKDGRLFLPDGMSYRMLVLPPLDAMTPALAKKIHQLVSEGATVLANSARPQSSPGLTGFPKSDETVAQLAGELWGDCDGGAVKEHTVGKGHLLWGTPLTEILKSLDTPADFETGPKLNWIHRKLPDGEVYFVANPTKNQVVANCQFRVKELAPELWNPVTGKISPLPVYQSTAGRVSLPLDLEPSGSRFVIFRHPVKGSQSVASFTRDGEAVFKADKPVTIQIQKATYGVPGDTQRTRDVAAKLQARLAGGVTELHVAAMAEGDDPAYGTVKTLTVNYLIDGRPATLSGLDPETIDFTSTETASELPADLDQAADGRFRLTAWQPGRYELRTADGKLRHAEVPTVPAAQEISGAWNLTFPPKWGAPPKITMNPLASWSDSTDTGVKYFSGTGTYTKSFNWVKAETGNVRSRLDLGKVEVMAQVTLNGHDLGILWRAPFQVDVTDILKPGPNNLEIRVANLWPNRMIGDAALPENQRFTWSSWQPFVKDTPLLKSGLLGPVKLTTAVVQDFE
jgi:hypothetical protein